MRGLLTSAAATPAPDPAQDAEPASGLQGLGAQLIDVVYGSEGVWHAWWLHAGATEVDEVCAIVPDLTPLLAIAAGTAASELSDLQRLLDRYGTTIRLVLPPGSATAPVAATVVNVLAEAGVQIRLGETRPWFFVSGLRVAVAPLHWSETDDGPVGVFRGETMAGALRDLFEHRWAQSTPWGGASGTVDDVLRLLATGRSDEEVAEALGVSLRTVRRRVAEAMAEYGASSRFELGYRVAAGTPSPPHH
jgi:DNA-binding CsgD family transcriptional regulator